MPYRVLVADSLPGDVLTQWNNDQLEVINKAGISPEELAQELPHYDALVVRSRTKVTETILHHATKLKIIGRAGAGVDNIDLDAATRHGVIVMNTPGGNTIAATEHTIGLMLAALRNIPQAHLSMKNHRWDRKTFIGRELYEKTIGIIGLGKIGREVARRLSAFQATLLGYDPFITPELAHRLGVQLVSLDELFQRADIITLHTPKMPETMNLVNQERLQQCKDGVVLINCARGGLVNEADLLEALNTGKVSVAAFDVFESEPPQNWELIDHPNFIATPHLGASTREAQEKVARQILEQIAHFFETGVPRNAVNFMAVDEKLLPVLQPYFELAYRLGQAGAQIGSTAFSRERLTAISVRFYGEITDLPVDPIFSHLLMGVFRQSATSGKTTEFINAVNALSIARERGIELEISRKDHPLTSHTHLVACDFHFGDHMIHLSGTVYAKGIFRLVEFGDYTVDANLNGSMIIIENEDVPGVIGRTGLILAEHQLNIAHVSSGRRKESGTAVNVFNIEGTVTSEVLEAIGQIPQVNQVWYASTEPLL